MRVFRNIQTLIVISSSFSRKNCIFSSTKDSKYGSYSYEGPVKSIDDAKTVVFESQNGFVIPNGVFSKGIFGGALLRAIRTVISYRNMFGLKVLLHICFDWGLEITGKASPQSSLILLHVVIQMRVNI